MSTGDRSAQVLSSVLSPLYYQSTANGMLFTAALSLLISLGSSLVVASPVYDGLNTTLLRRCGTDPSQQLVSQAEAHFAKNKVMAISEVGISAVINIPVYCTQGFSHSL